MNWELIFKLGIGILGLATAVVVAVARIKEYRAKKADPEWKPNPKRCEEMRDRVIVLEERKKLWEARFDHVDEGLETLQAGLTALTNLHLKG